jgi:hypothetical protein
VDRPAGRGELVIGPALHSTEGTKERLMFSLMPASAPAPLLDWATFSAIRVQTVFEILVEEASRPTFLVEELIHGRATLLYGPAKGGKSHLVVELVTAMSRGEAWHGRQANRVPERILVLSSDPGGRAEYARRFGRLVDDTVGLATPPRVGDRDGWRRTAAEALASGVGLIVLDNFYSWAREADINASAEVGAALACLDEVTEACIPLLVVHHTSKTGNSPAGVHAIEAYFRHLLLLTGEGKLTVRGNDVAPVSYRLVRWDGRTVEVLPADRRTSAAREMASPSASGTRPPTKAQLRRTDKLDRAERLLEQAPAGLSLNKQHAYLVEHLDDVTTLNQAKTQVQNLRALGRLPSERAAEVPTTDRLP